METARYININLSQLLVVILIENYCNFSLKDSEGNAALHHSVSVNSGQVLDYVFKALIKFGRVDSNINVKGHAAFHSVIFAGNSSSVRYLLGSEKVEIRIKRETETGSDALHLACTKGNLQVAKQFLNLLYVLINERNKSGQTPLMAACCKSFCSLIELLVKAGADVNAVDKNCDSAIFLMIRRIYLDDRHYGFKTNKTILFPSAEESPDIYKIYDKLSRVPCYKETMEKHPSIASVCYLIRHGGDADSGRHWISKVRDANVQVILDGFSSELQVSMDKEQLIVNCLLCNEPSSRMRFGCCGNESCLFCPPCTKNLLRCPCCNSAIKSNERQLRFILCGDDSLVLDHSKGTNDNDSSHINHQPSDPKVDDNIFHPIVISNTKSSNLSSTLETFKIPTVLPIIQTPTTFAESNLPVTHNILSPSPRSSLEPLNHKWLLRKGASIRGKDLLEDGVGNSYTLRSPKVWQCTRQSDKTEK